MANASHKHIGAGAQGKGTGSGAMTTADTADIPDNMVLSNRDKAQHSDERGLDGRMIQTEQMRDHASNRRIDPSELVDETPLDDVGDEDPDSTSDGGGLAGRDAS